MAQYFLTNATRFMRETSPFQVQLNEVFATTLALTSLSTVKYTLRQIALN